MSGFQAKTEVDMLARVKTRKQPLKPGEGMSRFNATATPVRVTNLAGGTAHVQDARNELAAIMMTSFVQPKAYRTADAELHRLKTLVASEPLFAAKAAVYARNEMGMRSISHVVAGEVTELVKGEQWVKNFVRDVVRRADDMTEIVAYRSGTYGLHPIPNSLKKGLQLAFSKFDGHALAKYAGASKTLSMVDLVNLVKPRPNDRNGMALADLVAGRLKNTQTWESKLSSGADKGETWAQLLRDNQLGYMALLRNLRNIAVQANDEAFAEALVQLTDSEKIRKSLVLPFRFYTAYLTLRQSDVPPMRLSLILGSLSAAADVAVANIEDMPGTTLIALDTSGSMTSAQVSDRSGATVAQIGAMFAAALHRRLAGRAAVRTFDTSAQNIALDPSNGVLTTAQLIIDGMRGGGTNMDLVFDHDDAYDRVIVISDMQAWTNGEWGSQGNYYSSQGNYYSSPVYSPYWAQQLGAPAHKPASNALNRYRERTGADPSVFALDLAGYGSLQFPADRCFQLSGWSDQTLSLLGRLEGDRDALVNDIDAVGADW